MHALSARAPHSGTCGAGWKARAARGVDFALLVLALNLCFGLLPALILGASIAAGISDDRHHRTMFILVYGLWSITLAMWNWMRSYPAYWIALWLVTGVVTLTIAMRRRARRS